MSSKKSGASTKKYRVDRILKRKETTNGVKFLVKWEGLPSEEATWESQDNLLVDCPTVVAHFLTAVTRRDTSEELYKAYLYTVDIPANQKVDKVLYNKSEYLCGAAMYRRVYINSKEKFTIFLQFFDRENTKAACNCTRHDLLISYGVKCDDIIPPLAVEPGVQQLFQTVSVLHNDKFYFIGEKEFHSSQTLEMLRTKATAIPISKIGEHGVNNVLKCQIEAVIQEFLNEGFVVKSQQSMLMNCTRFALSKPDLVVYKSISPLAVVGIVGFLDHPIIGFVAEGQIGQKPVDKDCQTCAGMVELAGDLVYQNLSNGCLVFTVVVLGLLFNYTSQMAKLYKLTMNFEDNTSFILCPIDEINITEGFQRVLALLKSGKY